MIMVLTPLFCAYYMPGRLYIKLLCMHFFTQQIISYRTHRLTGWEKHSKLRKSFFGLKFWIRIFTKTEHNVHVPYFGWKSCWLMAALPAGEWLFKIILEARKRKSSNNGLMSEEPGTKHNMLRMRTDFHSDILSCTFLSEKQRHPKPLQSMHTLWFNSYFLRAYYVAKHCGVEGPFVYKGKQMRVS
jgi:hypothetical protein